MIRELEFKLLCRQHCDEIYRYARTLLGNDTDAEDATQEVLLRLWRHLPTTRLRSARAWLFRTTRNYCLDQIRRRSNQVSPVPVDGSHLVERADELAADPSQAADATLLRRDFEAALQELPEAVRSVFILYEISGLRYREIAQTLEMPLNTVKAYVFRARGQLRELLSKHQPCLSPSTN